MKRFILVMGVFSIFCIALFIAAMVSPDVGLFIKLHTVYAGYNNWKHNGGPWSSEYYQAIKEDFGRDSMVAGIPVKDLFRKFPFLTDGSRFAEESYNGQALYYEKEHDKRMTLYWFDAMGRGGYAIRAIDGVGISIRLFKG